MEVQWANELEYNIGDWRWYFDAIIATAVASNAAKYNCQATIAATNVQSANAESAGSLAPIIGKQVFLFPLASAILWFNIPVYFVYLMV